MISSKLLTARKRQRGMPVKLPYRRGVCGIAGIAIRAATAAKQNGMRRTCYAAYA